MVFHRVKKTKGSSYNYLVESLKFEGKVYQVQKYIGLGRMKRLEIEAAKAKYKDQLRNEALKKKASLSASGHDSTTLSSEQLIRLEAVRYVFREFTRKLHPNEIERLKREFDISYVYSTTSTEGNTCTLVEVSRILENNLSPKGRTFREIYEVRNFEEVLRFRKRYSSALSKGFILKLHRLIMRDIDLYTLGTFRRIEVTILGSETIPVPAIFVEEEMDRLLEWYHEMKGKMHPVELATRFHGRFEAIHPFTDGNGRVGRELFNFTLTRQGFPALNFPVSKRDEYLDGLEMAQKGNLAPILGYILDNLVEQMRVRLGDDPLRDIINESRMS